MKRINRFFLSSILVFSLFLGACSFKSDSGGSRDVGPGEIENAYGIALNIRNPYGRMKYCEGYLYVSGASQLMGGNVAENDPVTIWGGVQRINVSTYEKDDVIYSGHSISDVAVISSTQAYLIEYIAWGNSALKRFNPSTGVVEDGYVAELGAGASGTYGKVNLISMDVDKNGKLWVCCSSTGDCNLYIIDTSTDQVEEKVCTDLAPQYLTFCGDYAVVVTSTLTYTSGAHSVVPIEQTDGSRSPVNKLTADISDLAIDSYGDYFYRIQRYQSDSVMKFHIDNPGEVRDDVNTQDPDVIWQYSTMEDIDETEEAISSTNPHSLAVYSDTRGFLSRYGSSYAWVVDPSADSQDEFMTGRLDLSTYNDDDGTPEMSSAVIAEGKLFIAIQRLYSGDSDGIWKASSCSYVAVFDPETCEEIDTRD